MIVTKIGGQYMATATDTTTGITYCGFGHLQTIARLCCYDTMRGDK